VAPKPRPRLDRGLGFTVTHGRLHAGEHGTIRPTQLEQLRAGNTAVNLREDDFAGCSELEECDTCRFECAYPLVLVFHSVFCRNSQRG